ncbi:hypothetical protein MMC22_010302 [Lobaria immixta]|nr:hypothetical protein [Lobaria immixta]
MPIRTLAPKPQSASLKQLSIEDNANAPDNPEPNSPSPTPDLPIQFDFSGPNSPKGDSPSNPVLTFASPQLSSPPRLTLDGSMITANSLSQFVIDKQTLRPGGPEITISGTPLSLAPSATHIVIGGNTVKLAESPSPLFTLPGRVITPNSESQYIIGGQTLIPGSSISVSGTFISLAPSASKVIIGSSTLQLLAPSPLSLPNLIVGGKTIAANSASQYIVDGQTLGAGSPAITVSGTSISLSPSGSNVVIGGSTIPFIATPSTPHPLTIGAKVIFPNSASKYIIDGQTLVAGSPAITVSGMPISLAPSGSNVVIGGSTIPFVATPSTSHPLTIGAKVIFPNSASEYVIDGQTLVAGSAAITVSGTPISLAPSGSNVVIGGSTISFATAPSILSPLTIGGTLVFPNSASEYVLGSQTIIPGAHAVIISGTPISLGPSASNIVIDSITSALIGSATPLPPLTVDGTTILPNSASEYLIGSQTLIPGASAITISGTRISLAPSASALVVGSKTIPITSGPTITTSLPLITIGNSIFTPNAASQYIIADQTLVPGGPAITVSGTRISLAPQATDVVVGTSTEGLGRLILAGVGATIPASLNGPASATGPAAFQGGATRVYGWRWIVAILIFGWGFWAWL